MLPQSRRAGLSLDRNDFLVARHAQGHKVSARENLALFSCSTPKRTHIISRMRGSPRVNTSHSEANGQGLRTGRAVRFIFGVFLAGVSAYLIGLWFIWGVTASKWIGIDSMAAQMERLNSRSRLAGYVALTLQILALWIFPPKQTQTDLLGGGCRGVLSYPEEPEPTPSGERHGNATAYALRSYSLAPLVSSYYISQSVGCPPEP